MNRLFSLPVEILRLIYSFDDTYKTLFQRGVLENGNIYIFYQKIMEKKYPEDCHGTIMSIISCQDFNQLERFISDDQIVRLEHDFCKTNLGNCIEIFKYLLSNEDGIPFLLNVPEYIVCLHFPKITISEFLHRFNSQTSHFWYHGWIYVFGDWAKYSFQHLCKFENWHPEDDENSEYCNNRYTDVHLSKFLKDNVHFISESKMVIMYLFGCQVSIYQTDDRLFIVLDENRMTIYDEDSENDFNRIISKLAELF